MSRLSFTAALLLAISSFSYVDATDLFVPSDYPTIQSAIDAAVDGDTVHVASGTYYEAIDLLGKKIAVIGAGRDTTTIDATGLNTSVVTAMSGETIESTIHGFKLTGGNGTSGFGGGIKVDCSSLTISSVLIEGNSAGYGAAIDVHKSPLTSLSDVIVCNNSGRSVVEFWGERGELGSCVVSCENLKIHNVNEYIAEDLIAIWYGAICFSEKLLIENNQPQGPSNAIGFYEAGGSFNETIIENNQVNRGAYVFGNHYWDGSFVAPLEFQNLSICNNLLASAIYTVDEANFQITKSVITANHCSRELFHVGGGTFAEIANSTIADNVITNTSNGGYGSVINSQSRYAYGVETTTITNSIIWNNVSTANISDIYKRPQQYEGYPVPPVIVRHSILTDLWIEDGSVAVQLEAPLFVAPQNGDYTLQPTSPAIDAGDPNSPLDADGSIADLGAYPYLTFAPEYPTGGFMEPLSSDPVTVKGNRVLPLKVQIFDESGIPITEFGTAPKVKVTYSATNAEPIDVTSDALPEGVGDEAGFFEVTGDFWHFNLETKPFQSPGEYTIEIITGDASEYKLATTTATFIRE